MAMNSTQSAIATKLRQLCKAQLIINNQLAAFSAMWTTEGMGSVPSEDWAAVFPGVTAGEAIAAKNGFDTVHTTLGNYESSTLSRDMLKLCDQVPNGS